MSEALERLKDGSWVSLIFEHFEQNRADIFSDLLTFWFVIMTSIVAYLPRGQGVSRRCTYKTS